MVTAFKEVEGVRFTTHHHLVPESRFGGAVLLLPPIHRRGTDSDKFFIPLLDILRLFTSHSVRQRYLHSNGCMITSTPELPQYLCFHLYSFYKIVVCVCGGGVNKVICDVYLSPYGAEVNERLVVEMMACKLFLPDCKRDLALCLSIQ